MDPEQPIPPALIEFAGRMYDSARAGDVVTFRQALPSGLPPNLTNEKGDTLVRQTPGNWGLWEWGERLTLT